MNRKIIFYKDQCLEFYLKQDKKVQEKIEYVLDLIRFEERVPVKFYKLLKGTDSIYEIRILTTYKNIRILCFNDGELIILTNFFVKKTQKTPRSDIRRAEKYKREYFIEKRRE